MTVGSRPARVHLRYVALPWWIPLARAIPTVVLVMLIAGFLGWRWSGSASAAGFGPGRAGRQVVAFLAVIGLLYIVGRVVAMQYGRLAVLRLVPHPDQLVIGIRGALWGWTEMRVPQGTGIEISVAPAPDWAPWLTTFAGREFHHCRISVEAGQDVIFVDHAFPIHLRAVDELRAKMRDAGIDNPVSFIERIHSRRPWWREVNRAVETEGSK